MSKNITRLTTALAREAQLIPASEELAKGEVSYKHGSGCGGSCCRDKEPRVQFSGERPSGEKIAFTCHITSLDDIFRVLEDESNDSLVRKLAGGVHEVK